MQIIVTNYKYDFLEKYFPALRPFPHRHRQGSIRGLFSACPRRGLDKPMGRPDVLPP